MILFLSPLTIFAIQLSALRSVLVFAIPTTEIHNPILVHSLPLSYCSQSAVQPAPIPDCTLVSHSHPHTATIKQSTSARMARSTGHTPMPECPTNVSRSLLRAMCPRATNTLKHVQFEKRDATPNASSLRSPSQLRQRLSSRTCRLWAQRPCQSDATARHIEALW